MGLFILVLLSLSVVQLLVPFLVSLLPSRFAVHLKVMVLDLVLLEQILVLSFQFEMLSSHP